MHHECISNNEKGETGEKEKKKEKAKEVEKGKGKRKMEVGYDAPTVATPSKNFFLDA